MTTLNFELFIWWVISISWSIAFLILVSIYLYSNSKTKYEGGLTKWNTVNLVKDFVFIWVLLGLLIFYIISVNIGSAVIFAVGNIIVEVILIIYLFKSSSRNSEQTS